MGSRELGGARPVPRSWPGRGCSLPLPGDGADYFCPLPLQKGRSSRQNSIYSISGEKGECGAGGEAGMAKQRGKLGETGGHGTTGTAVPRPFFQKIRPHDIIGGYLGSQLCVREVTPFPLSPLFIFFLPFPWLHLWLAGRAVLSASSPPRGHPQEGAGALLGPAKPP